MSRGAQWHGLAPESFCFGAKGRDAVPRRENSQKRGLPTRKTVNRLTPLLEPASEKAQGRRVSIAPPQFES